MNITMGFIFMAIGLFGYGLGMFAGHLLWNKPLTARTLNAKTIEERIRIADEAERKRNV